MRRRLHSSWPGLTRPSCVRERALSGWCKSISGVPTKPVAEGNCVIARWGGEQLEAEQQSVGDELDSAGPYGEPPVDRRSPELCERRAHDAEDRCQKRSRGGSVCQRHVGRWLGWRGWGQVPKPAQAGARSAGLEAGHVTQAQWSMSFGSGRPHSRVAIYHPSSRTTSQLLRHAASCHINSYPVAVRGGCTRNPHTRGSGLGNRDHSLAAAR